MAYDERRVLKKEMETTIPLRKHELSAAGVGRN